jgi:hypothetical protein
MVHNAGEDVLLLDIIWDSFWHLKSYVLGNKKLVQVKHTHFDHLLTHLHAHPISDPLSKEHSILHNISKLFDVFCSGSQITPHARLSVLILHSLLKFLHAQLSRSI